METDLSYSHPTTLLPQYFSKCCRNIHFELFSHNDGWEPGTNLEKTYIHKGGKRKLITLTERKYHSNCMFYFLELMHLKYCGPSLHNIYFDFLCLVLVRVLLSSRNWGSSDLLIGCNACRCHLNRARGKLSLLVVQTSKNLLQQLRSLRITCCHDMVHKRLYQCRCLQTCPGCSYNHLVQTPSGPLCHTIFHHCEHLKHCWKVCCCLNDLNMDYHTGKLGRKHWSIIDQDSELFQQLPFQ